MRIVGTQGMSGEEINAELQRGAHFVIYEYCISILVMTFKRSSNEIYFVKAGENRIVKGLPYLLVSLLLGWWGFPWGIIYTPMAIATNLRGGKDVTSEVLASLRQEMPQPKPARVAGR